MTHLSVGRPPTSHGRAHIVYCKNYSTILRNDFPFTPKRLETQVTTNVHAGTDDHTVSLRDPYPFFAHKRREAGVFHGTVMDYSKTPESLMPKREYSAVSFDAVNKVFRDGRVFSSAPYDKTIGLFMGPTILAMEGKKHRDHRNLVSAAFKSKALARWEPTIVRPICNALIDEFIDSGEADLVRNFTFEFPTRVIAELLGLPAEDLPTFRTRAVQLISYHVNYERAFEASAALKDYFLEQIEQRKAKPTQDIIGDLVTAEIDGEKLSDEAIYSFLRLLLPAGLETTYRSSGNLLYLLLTHPDQFAAVQRRPRAAAAGDRGRAALRDAADHRAAVHHRGHRARRRRDSGAFGGRRVHGLCQSRRAPLGTFGGIRHLPQAPAAHLLRRR